MSNANNATKAGLIWIESNLNSVIAHCKDSEIKNNLKSAKKFLIKAIDRALQE